MLDSSGLGIWTLRDEVKETGLLWSCLHSSLHKIKPTRIPGSIDEDDLEDTPLTEELSAVDSCREGKVILF